MVRNIQAGLGVLSRAVPQRGAGFKLTWNLAARTFLFSFVPMCAALAGSFIAINGAIRETLKSNLKNSLIHAAETVRATENRLNRRNSQSAVILSGKPELKAAAVQVRETAPGSPARQDAILSLEGVSE